MDAARIVDDLARAILSVGLGGRESGCQDGRRGEDGRRGSVRFPV